MSFQEVKDLMGDEEASKELMTKVPMSRWADELYNKPKNNNMEKYLLKVWIWLQGKKTSVMAIAGLILMFVRGRGIIQQDTAELISGILVALGLGANYKNAQERKNK